jgi:hypothetical protein
MKLHKCEKCNIEHKISDLILKMGGLICPQCRVILVFPHEKEFSEERKRRNKDL